VTHLELDDGRTLEYVTAGPADGFPLVLHHGTPSGALLYPELIETATRHGLRIVLHGRPGYAGSTPRPGRTVAGVVADLTALLDALGAPTFVTIGWSGGGPHALACAALLPDRCLAAATIAGVAPYGAEGLDWFAGMGDENLAEFGAALAGVPELTAYLEAEAGSLASVTAADVVGAFGDLLSDVDSKVLVGGFADYLAASSRMSVSTGVAGWRDDDIAFVADWGFPLDALTVPVAIWQGAHDRMVPFDHGRWLAAHVAGARVHLEPGEGHLSLMVNAFDAVVADLLTLRRD
jgi:pimeloyl-ACP methyl ester carboxylesterase